MIFISLGTQDKSFHRLLEEVESLCEKGLLRDRIVVQAGYTKFNSKFMEIFDYMDQKEFENNIQDCNLLIAHGGVGTIMTAMNYHKKIIGVPRLAKYGEHHNDHQVEILSQFDEKGYLIFSPTVEMLEDTLRIVATFNPKPYQCESEKVIDVIRTFINNID